MVLYLFLDGKEEFRTGCYIRPGVGYKKQGENCQMAQKVVLARMWTKTECPYEEKSPLKCLQSIEERNRSLLKYDIILDDVFDSVRHRSAGEESICPFLVGVCDQFSEGKLENL